MTGRLDLMPRPTYRLDVSCAECGGFVEDDINQAPDASGRHHCVAHGGGRMRADGSVAPAGPSWPIGPATLLAMGVAPK